VDVVELLDASAATRGTAASRPTGGFSAPPFEPLVFGPVVHVDLLGDDPSGELLERTLDEVFRLTKQ
jgi:hypothetical protein